MKIDWNNIPQDIRSFLHPITLKKDEANAINAATPQTIARNMGSILAFALMCGEINHTQHQEASDYFKNTPSKQFELDPSKNIIRRTFSVHTIEDMEVAKLLIVVACQGDNTKEAAANLGSQKFEISTEQFKQLFSLVELTDLPIIA